jgi:Asp-tRNA(Asn)/Glu-tRNA(Gln) amidotransferase A subunit family amidase
MTVKDQFDVRGFDSTIGYVGRAFRPASDDAVLVAMLRQLGAVFLAKTNLPQSIMVGQPFSLHILPANRLRGSACIRGSTCINVLFSVV